MRLARSFIAPTALVLCATGCGGGSASDRVVNIAVRLGSPSGPTELAAVTRPSADRGSGRVLPITAIRKYVPTRLPTNVNQPVGRGINRYVLVRLASGKTISYGPLTFPPAITRLVAAMQSLAVDTPTLARHDANTTLTQWLRTLRIHARQDPTRRFRNLPRTTFFDRLRRLQRRYRFRVVQARILRPAQDAALLILQTDQPAAFVKAVPAIQHQLDPKRATNDDRTGWAYEGFYLQARDTHGIPFLAINNSWRGSLYVGGGQWASSDAYYPFQHG